MDEGEVLVESLAKPVDAALAEHAVLDVPIFPLHLQLRVNIERQITVVFFKTLKLSMTLYGSRHCTCAYTVCIIWFMEVETFL